MNPFRLNFLLKEKALLAHLLSKGDIMITLRKGGLSDPDQVFTPQSDTFFLSPTYYHHDTAIFAPEFHYDLPRIQIPSGEATLTISSFAKTEQIIRITKKSKINSLYGWSGYTRGEMEKMFDYKSAYLDVLILKAYTLPNPVIIDVPANYSGCKSWVELPNMITVNDYKPAITDIIYNYRKQILLDLLKD